MTEDYDAYVYDLDGTLVRLNVDWTEVAQDVAAVLRARDVRVENVDLWEMLELADETGHRQPVEETIADHEKAGARTSERLPLAGALPHDVPVGVCSLNAEAACRVALETYGLDGDVDVVVGRDSVDTQKPDPEPLLAAIEAVDVTPERTLFIGDSERDEVTAQRAGAQFAYVRDWLQKG